MNETVKMGLAIGAIVALIAIVSIAIGEYVAQKNTPVSDALESTEQLDR